MTGESTGVGAQLKTILAEMMGKRPEQVRIRASQRLREDLGFDSVMAVDLMVEIEMRLGVYFDPVEHDLGEIFSTVGALADFLAKASEGR